MFVKSVEANFERLRLPHLNFRIPTAWGINQWNDRNNSVVAKLAVLRQWGLVLEMMTHWFSVKRHIGPPVVSKVIIYYFSAVDGWWTTKVSQEHKGLGGVATSFGIQAGVLLGFSVYIKLEHAFPQTITLERFFLFLALVFFVSTILILIFADEETVRKKKFFSKSRKKIFWMG